MVPQFVAGLLGFAIASGLMPWVMSVARDYDLLDYPDSARRIHTTPVPRLGGVAIFAAVVLASAIVLSWDYLTSAFNIPLASMLPGVVIGCIIIFITGIVDDIKGVKPIVKLLAQAVAAIAVVSYGFSIDQISVAGNRVISLGFVAVPLTIIWMVGMTNAFNLIDGVDGLAGTFGLLGLTVAVAVDVLLHAGVSLIITASMLGALFAFLRYNRSPARIFLGDSGSMMLGFFLSIRLVVSATRPDGVTYFLVPLFALAYPLLDTSIAIARRWLRGHPFSRADGRHIHHQVLALGLSARRTVDMLGLFFACVAFLGMSITFAPPRVTLSLMVAGGVLVFAVFFYAIRWLRYTEFLELGASISSVIRNARGHVRNKIVANDIATKLNTAASLEEFAEILSDSASELGLLEVNLVVGNNHYIGPSSRQIWPHGNRPYRIDYPVTWERDGKHQEAVLRLWCERPDGRRHLGSERIASRLAPAIEGWFANTPVSVPKIDDIRSSGPHSTLHWGLDDDQRRTSGAGKPHKPH